MLLPAPPLYPRKRRAKRRAPVTPTPVVVGPVLVSAVFDYESLTLGFDRAIDVSGYVPSEIVVDDAGSQLKYGGTVDTTMLDPNTVKITVINVEEYFGEGVKLTASGGAGIVAVSDGEPWAGVSDLSLPYP